MDRRRGRALARLADARPRVRGNDDEGSDIATPADGPTAGAGAVETQTGAVQGRDGRVAESAHQQVVSYALVGLPRFCKKGLSLTMYMCEKTSRYFSHVLYRTNDFSLK